MKAIVISQYGDHQVLKAQEKEISAPQNDEVLVRIKACGINFIDIYQRKGIYPVQLPYTPGLEAAGVVEAIGENVTQFKVGDHVAYVNEPGAYAEKSLVKATRLIPLPDNLSFSTAAAFPLQGMTAHYLLFEFYKIKKGDFVLVHAAAGGVGLLLVQWATHLGAKVIGTVSTEEKAKMAKEAGAFEVINYKTHNFVEEVKNITKEGADYIIDGVGKETFAGNLDAAKTKGHITIFGSASGPADPIIPNQLMKRSLTLSGGSLFNFMQNREEILTRANACLKGIEEGWLNIYIDKELPLEQAAEAHYLLENRKSKGKLILKC